MISPPDRFLEVWLITDFSPDLRNARLSQFLCSTSLPMSKGISEYNCWDSGNNKVLAHDNLPAFYASVNVNHVPILIRPIYQHFVHSFLQRVDFNAGLDTKVLWGFRPPLPTQADSKFQSFFVCKKKKKIIQSPLILLLLTIKLWPLVTDSSAVEISFQQSTRCMPLIFSFIFTRCPLGLFWSKENKPS